MIRTAQVFVVATLVVIASTTRLSAQSDPIARLRGTWVRDSANGPDDTKPPSGETVVLARAGRALRLLERPTLDAEPSGPALDCVPGEAGPPKPRAGASRGCWLGAAAGHVGYRVYLFKDGTTTEVERGTLVVSTDGQWLRDEFELKHADRAATNHRHVYRKVR